MLNKQVNEERNGRNKIKKDEKKQQQQRLHEVKGEPTTKSTIDENEQSESERLTSEECGDNAIYTCVHCTALHIAYG